MSAHPASVATRTIIPDIRLTQNHHPSLLSRLARTSDRMNFLDMAILRMNRIQCFICSKPNQNIFSFGIGIILILAF
jgi:hypothetical protein